MSTTATSAVKTGEPALTETQFHKKMAVDLFNETWTLLDKPDRTPEDDALMSHSAHASRLHWGFVGNAENLAIGEWQVARVHAVLRQPDTALYHARRALETALQHQLHPFHVAFGHEAMARALSLTQPQAALAHLAAARQAAAGITDPEDLKLLEGDLATISISSENVAGPGLV
ncbi:hypothetical protein [Prosthecobacter sp.]|uniref:hypothetical protein n=1 Tax=Prosthecobacter sp. TaxID=1965333 RepID=UPI003782FFD2